MLNGPKFREVLVDGDKQLSQRLIKASHYHALTHVDKLTIRVLEDLARLCSKNIMQPLLSSMHFLSLVHVSLSCNVPVGK